MNNLLKQESVSSLLRLRGVLKLLLYFFPFFFWIVPLKKKKKSSVKPIYLVYFHYFSCSKQTILSRFHCQRVPWLSFPERALPPCPLASSPVLALETDIFSLIFTHKVRRSRGAWAPLAALAKQRGSTTCCVSILQDIAWDFLFIYSNDKIRNKLK